MSRLGGDFAGGLFRRLYWPENPAGLVYALAAAALLLIAYQVLLALLAVMALPLAGGGDGSDSTRAMVRSSLAAILPAALAAAALAWWLAGVRGGEAARVLSFRRPDLTGLGWLVLVLGFMLAMYVAVLMLVLALGIDLAQYTPGADGQPPAEGSAGEVKEAVFDLANEPLLFLLIFPSIAIGAPLIEELIFRGQLFAALSRTRLGVSGTTVVTSALWASLHMTEPWLMMGMIFIMGLMLGYLMYRFGSIWVPIVCHAVWNGAYALLVFTNPGGGT
jgi:membrane protease YdiL (CAAX protease family)